MSDQVIVYSRKSFLEADLGLTSHRLLAVLVEEVSEILLGLLNVLHGVFRPLDFIVDGVHKFGK